MATSFRTAFVIFIALLLTTCSGKETVPTGKSVEVIAHAGGQVNGYVYTNSREALECSILQGYRYIEFDFMFTADSVLVAAHDWKSFNERTGMAHKGDTAPVYNDFKMRCIDGLFTPLSAAEINEVFENDTTICLVTDKVSSPQVLGKYFPNLKRRMIVEAFSYNDYTALLEEGYSHVLYSCLATDLGEAVFKHLLFPNLFSGRRIEWITMYNEELDNPLFRIALALSSFKIALFTVNDLSEIPVNVRSAVGMVYSDILGPVLDIPCETGVEE